jgi:hypothetical protein
MCPTTPRPQSRLPEETPGAGSGQNCEGHQAARQLGHFARQIRVFAHQDEEHHQDGAQVRIFISVLFL